MPSDRTPSGGAPYAGAPSAPVAADPVSAFVTLSGTTRSFCHFIRYGARPALRKFCAAAIVAATASATLFADASRAAAQETGERPAEIVALGDSLTQGYGLPPEDGFVTQLQAWLDARDAHARVVNAGVSGDTTAGGRARLEWSLAGGADALIVALGGNDLLRGLPPAQTRANLDAILSEARGRGLPVLLIGQVAPGNYGAAYKAEFDAIWDELAETHGALLLRDFIAPITALPLQERAAAALVQSDNLHPSAAGVAMLVDHVGPMVLELLAQID